MSDGGSFTDQSAAPDDESAPGSHIIRIASVAALGAAHAGQSLRTSLCATSPDSMGARRKRSTPMSTRRVTLPMALFVCSVDITK